MQNIAYDDKTIYGNLYLRNRSVDREGLEKKISYLYRIVKSNNDNVNDNNNVNVNNTYICSSGVNALYLALRAACLAVSASHPNDPFTFLYSSELYAGTRIHVIQLLYEEFEHITFLPFLVPDNIYKPNPAFIRDISQVKIIFVESCTNPSGCMIDWISFLSYFPKENGKRPYVIVDNTWLTPTIFNPFVIDGVDSVVDSCTKYISGGQRIMGHITFKHSLEADVVRQKLIKLLSANGIHVSDEYCATVNRALDSLDLRLASAFKNLLKVIEWFKENDIAYCHPSDSNHPTFDVCSKYFNRNHNKTDVIMNTSGGNQQLGPAVILFHTEQMEYANICEKVGLVLATSYGKPHSIIDSYPEEGRKYKYFMMTNRYNQNDDATDNNKKQKVLYDKRGIWLRLSIGYDKDEGEKLLRQLPSFF